VKIWGEWVMQYIHSNLQIFSINIIIRMIQADELTRALKTTASIASVARGVLEARGVRFTSTVLY